MSRIDAFSACLKANGKSLNTIKGYILDINKYFKWFEESLSSLRSYNEFLISSGIQNDVVIQKTDMLKFQTEYASPTQVTELEVKQFMQKVLESKNKRNYAIVTLLAYTGMRISEALAIRLVDFNLQTGECIIRNGKGEKQRTVLMNTKIINALRDYLKDRSRYSAAEESRFLFVSKKNENLNRTVVNRIFQQFSPKITPHQLRHYGLIRIRVE
jgi:integrase/recombinase XerD